MNNLNIYQLVAEHKSNTPNKVACVYQHETITYTDLIDRVDLLASGMWQLGVNDKSNVALFCPNNIDFALCLLAIAKIGCAVVPLPLTLKGEALETALDSAQCDFLIAWPTVAKMVNALELIPSERIVTIGKQAVAQLTLEQLCSQSLVDVPIGLSGNPYILTMTSGSTGQPKPIVFTQDTKINRAFKATVEYYNLHNNEVVLVSTPLYHSLAQRSLLMPLMLGATVVILPKFTVQAWVHAIETYQVSFLFAVSSQLKALIERLQDRELQSLRCIVSSSATLDAEDKIKLLKVLKCRFHECYGASEVGVISDFDITEVGVPLKSVGKPLPSVKVKICSVDREEVVCGEIGEIACHSDTEFVGYFNQARQTADSYDTQGYFYTGDLGFLDERGYLYYVGRTKEVIKSGGINVFPSDIELIANQIPWLDECAALGVEDTQFGEVILVAYTKKHDAPEDTQTQLKLHFLAQLTDYQQPRLLLELDHLPKTEMGKIHKPTIKHIYHTQAY
ncbi:long-chain fatty acid--CoA ligase [Pseudoalteromonas citrea]|uniref:Long-chain fatty acid--CoA ligase n=1 Tax=Pseudoalteromonas citrea TaxID=43655 RepID=A0A5S3XVT2_9GAMM|nr:class I adenylate-forming enzyme family protein [Pseudoalteromonas citrea]TMP43475.1 long-chain fatty acid--CoA ligase [Pseudoalteromonas citrea]TMP62126.1 long-chain fatty acid--CoA ligase [Pseudoalteromonas citrea]